MRLKKLIDFILGYIPFTRQWRWRRALGIVRTTVNPVIHEQFEQSESLYLRFNKE